MGKRHSTRYPGVQARESEERIYKGKPDVCFTIDYRDATGKRIRKDIGWASQGFTATLANEIRLKLVHEAKMKVALGPHALIANSRVPSFQEAWERYKKWLNANGKGIPETIVKNYLMGFMTVPLNQITATRLEQLMEELAAKGLAPQTIRHAVGLIRRVMRRMVKWGYYNGTLPFDAIILPKVNNQRERFLTPEEARKLLAEIRRRSERTWLMTLISLHCGLRFGEIARMEWGHVNFSEMEIYIPESKNGCARHAIMTEAVAAALKSFPQRGVLVFPTPAGGISDSISKAFFRAVEACGLNTLPQGGKITDRRQRVVFHTLRHTYASWLAKSGQSQFVIADRLGHHSLEMTYRYTHLGDASRKQTAGIIDGMFHDTLPENQ